MVYTVYHKELMFMGCNCQLATCKGLKMYRVYSLQTGEANIHQQPYLIRGKDSLQLQLLFSCQLDVKCCSVLLQVLDPLCARNWKDIITLGQTESQTEHKHDKAKQRR